MKKAYISWSSGKDATFALHVAIASKDFSVEKLVTTLNTDFNRISMHGIRKGLLQQQAESLAIPLHIIPLHGNISMDSYTSIMEEHMSELKNEGFETAIFGDIFLEDLMEFRENQLHAIGLEGKFPLWKKNTTELAHDFIELGYQAIVVCVNANVLDKSFCGRLFDEQFLSELPENVDPCGENGEFHTFVFDGPLFRKPIRFEMGEKVLRDFSPNKKNEDDCFDEPRSWDAKFWYVDLLLPKSQKEA